jgi:hypothetical protein
MLSRISGSFRLCRCRASFNACGQAYFVGDDPYDALKRALKAEIDETAWAELNSTISRPFPKPEHGRICVTVTKTTPQRMKEANTREYRHSLNTPMPPINPIMQTEMPTKVIMTGVAKRRSKGPGSKQERPRTQLSIWPQPVSSRNSSDATAWGAPL